jgi:hypothetical protein
MKILIYEVSALPRLHEREPATGATGASTILGNRIMKVEPRPA